MSTFTLDAGLLLRREPCPCHLELCLGHELRTVEVNLTDRSSFNYPLLIGAKALREFNAAVDPAKRFTAGKPSG